MASCLLYVSFLYAHVPFQDYILAHSLLLLALSPARQISLPAYLSISPASSPIVVDFSLVNDFFIPLWSRRTYGTSRAVFTDEFALILYLMNTVFSILFDVFRELDKIINILLCRKMLAFKAEKTGEGRGDNKAYVF